MISCHCFSRVFVSVIFIVEKTSFSVRKVFVLLMKTSLLGDEMFKTTEMFTTRIRC